VARVFGLGRNTEFLIGLETEYEETPTVDPDFLHCFVDSRLAPGYLGWVAPGVNMTQVGLAVSESPFGSTRKPDFDAFRKRIDSYFALWNCEVKDRRSGPIPCGGLVAPISTHRVLLTGDAAGLVSPLTAGGIRLAFHYGRRAGVAISEFLQDGGADPGTLMAHEYPIHIEGLAAPDLVGGAANCAPERNTLHPAHARAGAMDLFSKPYDESAAAPGQTQISCAVTDPPAYQLHVTLDAAIHTAPKSTLSKVSSVSSTFSQPGSISRARAPCFCPPTRHTTSRT
jgi:hypothetical protein